MGLDERSSSDRLHNAGYQIVQTIRLQTKNIDLLSYEKTGSRNDENVFSSLPTIP